MMDNLLDLLPPCPNNLGDDNFSQPDAFSFSFLGINFTELLPNDSSSPSPNTSCWSFDASPYSDGMKRVIDKLNIYLTPVIIIIGITGNFLSFLVFTLTHLRRQSSSVYLASLALVDIVFLLALSVVWLSWIHVPWFHQQGWCQIVLYMTNVCTFLSVWLVTSFTVDRYVFCYHPLWKERFCTTRGARIVVLLLVLIGLVTYSFSTWTSGVHYMRGGAVSLCMPFPQYYNMLTTIMAVDSVVTLLIPSTLVVVLNVRIVLRIMSVERQRQPFQRGGGGGMVGGRGPVAQGPMVSFCHESLSSGCPVHVRFQTHPSMDKRTSAGGMLSSKCGGTVSTTSTSSKSRRRRSIQYRTARMLLIVSSVFVLLSFPGHIFRIHAFIQSSLHDEFSTYRKDLTWHEIFNLINHLNFAINIFVYSASGRQFRIGLKILYTRLQHKADNFRLWRDQRKLPTNI